MDFAYLVESGSYSKEDLPEKEQMFIEGMESAYETIDSFLACRYPEDDVHGELDKIRHECATDALEDFKDWLRATINENIVALNDEAIVDDLNGE